MPPLVLHLQNIDEAGKDFAFELSHAWLDHVLHDATLRADPAYGPGQLHVHIQQNGLEYLVHGKLRAHLLTECGRCLGDAKVPVDVDLAALFARATQQPQPDVLELTEDDLQREEFTGQDIVLDAWVREHLVLEVPMQPLCSSDCKGIDIPEKLRPEAGVFPSDGGIDPRLAPLSRLRDKVPAASTPKQTITKGRKANKE